MLAFSAGMRGGKRMMLAHGSSSARRACEGSCKEPAETCNFIRLRKAAAGDNDNQAPDVW
jgi:hypothetical protein